MPMRSSKPQNPVLGSEWVKPGAAVWLEVRDEKGQEVLEYLPAVVKDILPSKSSARLLFPSDGSERESPLSALHQRSLEHALVADLAEIPVLNDAELLQHFQLLYASDEIYCYCGPSLIALNPYKTVAHTVAPETFELVRLALRKRQLERAPPHVWTVAASAFRNIEAEAIGQAICVNGESGAGKTESAKKCLEFLTRLQEDDSAANAALLAHQILACNPVLEAFGNAKTVRNDNSSRFGKYVKLFFDPGEKLRIVGATLENYLLEKSRVVSLAKEERGFHIFYAMCRFMPLPAQQAYLLAKDGRPCEPAYFKILRGSGLYELPRINDQEFFEEVAKAFKLLGFSAEETDAVWRILSCILHMGNFEVDSSGYEEGKSPCAVVENADFAAAVKLLACDPRSLQEALTLRVRQVQTQVIKTPHRPESVVDFFLAMAKDLYNSLFGWLVRKLNLTLAAGLAAFEGRRESLRSVGLLDIFGFEIFERNFLEQLFINYANERLQGLYIDHIFKNECAIFKAEGLDKYIALITYKDNLGLVRALDSPAAPPGLFPLTNQACRLNQRDESLMNEMRRVHASASAGFISFHKLRQNVFFVRHTAREVEYTVDGFVEKSRDEISLGIVRTIEAAHPQVARIYRGLVGQAESPEPQGALNPNAKFLSYKFCADMDALMEELRRSACHFVRCVKPNEAKRPDHWVGYLVLRQITYMGLLDSLKVRKFNYPVRFRHADFYKRYQDIDANKEGSAPFRTLEAAGENFRRLNENLLGKLGLVWGERDVLLGKTKVFLNEPFKFQLDEILKVKQKAKREALEVLVDFYRNQIRRSRVVESLRGMSRSIQLARGTLASLSAKVEHVRFRARMQLLRRLQAGFRLTLHYRALALQHSKAGFIAKVLRLKKVQETVKKVLRAKRAVEFISARLCAKVYKARRKFCRKLAEELVAQAWQTIKGAYGERSALEIQRAFRAFRLRKKEAPAIRGLEEKVRKQVLWRSLTLIQANVRGFLVRGRLRKVRAAARTLQGFVRGRWLRGYFLRLKGAVVRIQRCFRKSRARAAVVKERLKDFLDQAPSFRQFALREYESLLGALPLELKASEVVDVEFGKWAKRLVSADSAFQDFVPNPPDVEIAPKAKLFAMPFDLALGAETLESFPGTWSGELRSLARKLGERSERLLHVFAGDSSTLCVSDELRVYAFGANDFGQLCSEERGGGFSGRTREVLNLSKNALGQISLGGDRGAAVSQSGRAFFWGKFTGAQLGLADRRPLDGLLVANAVKEEAVAVAVNGAVGPRGEELSFVLGKSGQVFVFGLQNNEQNAENSSTLGNNEGRILEPTRLTEFQRDVDFGEIQRNYHQSLVVKAKKSSSSPQNAPGLSLLKFEGALSKEKSKSPQKSHAYFPREKSSGSNFGLPKEIDPYKKIIFISSGIDFSLFLSEKGVLFSLGENKFGELGLNDRLPRPSPCPILSLRRANERVEEVSCGLKHALCRTNLGRVYGWGFGSSHQNGHPNRKDLLEPKEVAFGEPRPLSLGKIRGLAAAAQGSYFFFEDGALFLLGKCGPGVFAHPARLPYQTRMFQGKMKEEFVPVKLFASWSRMMSVGYLVFLDFREVENAKNFKEKVAGFLAAKWRPGFLLPNSDDNVYKYVQSKNFLRENPGPMSLDLRFSGAEDGRPKSARELSTGQNRSERDFTRPKSSNSGRNGSKSPGNFSPNKNSASPNKKAQKAISQSQSQNALPEVIVSFNEQIRLEGEKLGQRFAELRGINNANTNRAKLACPPLIAPPMKGFKEEPLDAKVLKVDANDRVVSAQSIKIPQRVFKRAFERSRSPGKISPGKLANNWESHLEESSGQEAERQRKSDLQRRSTSKSSKQLQKLEPSGQEDRQNDSFVQISKVSASKISKSPNNVFKDDLFFNEKSQSPSQLPPNLLVSKNQSPLNSQAKLPGIRPKQISNVLPSRQEKHVQIVRQSEGNFNPFSWKADSFKDSKPKASDQEFLPRSKSKDKAQKSPANKTSAKNKESIGQLNLQEIDLRSKKGLLSQASSKKTIQTDQRTSFKKQESKVSKISVAKGKEDKKTVAILNESIFAEVEKIMKKDPTKWTNIEREIINNYVQITKGLASK